MLKDTLIVWGGEFGRQPTAEYAKGSGRDHNSYGFTMFMAGGGLKGGISVGATDELGSRAVEDEFHVRGSVRSCLAVAVGFLLACPRRRKAGLLSISRRSRQYDRLHGRGRLMDRRVVGRQGSSSDQPPRRGDARCRVTGRIDRRVCRAV